VTICEFGLHQTTLARLPQGEQAKVNALAARIRSAGPRRVHLVQIIGHADADPRGRAFEKKISFSRAASVRAALQQRVGRSGGRLVWSTVGAGASRPVVRNPMSEADRRRNRRVQVNLVAPRVSQSRRVAAHGLGQPARPQLRSRPCCMLAPTQSPFSADGNILDPATVGTHNGPSEQVGLIYSGLLGFLDFGHIRDMCDLTHAVFSHITAVNGQPSTVVTLNGHADITSPIPRSSWLLVARAIAADDGLAHEIITYDQPTPGGHNSSFSPEDLASNQIGTRVAGAAITAGGPFDAAVTQALNSLLAGAGAESKAGTLRAFNAINHCWVEFSGAGDLLNNDYLRRRNFGVFPWKAPGMRNHPSPTTIFGETFAAAQPFYTFTAHGRIQIPKSRFAAEIARIRTDAAARYGPKFDQPTCP
jgi:hypothetical protein